MGMQANLSPWRLHRNMPCSDKAKRKRKTKYRRAKKIVDFIL